MQQKYAGKHIVAQRACGNWKLVKKEEGRREIGEKYENRKGK